MWVGIDRFVPEFRWVNRLSSRHDAGRSTGYRVSLAVALAGFAFASSAGEKPGTMPGGFQVTDQGAGTYTLPISTPAATGGLRPNLALTYNHLAGNGLAGMRWTLSGFSAITRCRQTYAQDGQVEPVEYDSDDRFCLDGQRLVRISGTYGASGAEYRTELETFQKIKSYGSAGSGPGYFEIQHGNGMTSRYGYNSDSSVEVDGANDIRIWYISYTEDQFGNRITYGYDDTSDTEVLPDEVLWTTNDGQGLSVARYSVSINYENRPTGDPRSGFDSGGAPWDMTKRISSIVVDYFGPTEIATYDLAYSQDPVTKRSQLDSVTV